MEWYHFVFIGLYVVHKFRHYIPSGKFVDDGPVGEFKTLNEARFTTYKKVHEEHPDKDIHLEDTQDRHGAYFVIKYIIGIIEFIIVPVKKD